jgi:hypothetical protein
MSKKSSDFVKHISNNIESLTKAYTLFVKELDSINNKFNVKADAKEDHYRFFTERLKRAIDAFKDEMIASLGDFYFQMDNNLISPHAISHIKSKIDDLKKVHKTIGKKVPDQILKEKLEHNYFFHANVHKLTPKKIMEYFELNYMLHKKQSKKKH